MSHITSLSLQVSCLVVKIWIMAFTLQNGYKGIYAKTRYIVGVSFLPQNTQWCQVQGHRCALDLSVGRNIKWVSIQEGRSKTLVPNIVVSSEDLRLSTHLRGTQTFGWLVWYQTHPNSRSSSAPTSCGNLRKGLGLKPQLPLLWNGPISIPAPWSLGDLRSWCIWSAWLMLLCVEES